jgi:hypothetical protein
MEKWEPRLPFFHCMNKTDFENFVCNTTNHNWTVSKTDTPMSFITLLKYALRNKNKPVFLYYQDDAHSDKINSYYDVDNYGGTAVTLKSVKSIIVSDNAIILSYIPQSELSKISFDFSMLAQIPHYTTTDDIVKLWHYYKEQNHGSTTMIRHYDVYIQYIEDALGWSLCDGKKIFRSFNFSRCGAFNERGVYFTPHY